MYVFFDLVAAHPQGQVYKYYIFWFITLHTKKGSRLVKATLRSSDMSKRSEARPKLFKINKCDRLKIFFIQYFQVGYIKQQI